MIRRVWAGLHDMLPRRSRRSALVVAIESLIAGLLEATLLVLVVRVALTIAGDSENVALDVPLLSVQLSPTSALAVAAAAGVVMLALHLHVARLTARLSSLVLQRTRERIVNAFAHATWERQSLEREGSLQETVSSLAGQTAGLVALLTNLMTATIALGALLVAALLVDALITVIVMVFGMILFAAMRPVARMTRRRSREYVQNNSAFTEAISQWASLAMELRVFGVEAVAVERLSVRSRTTSEALRRSRFITRAGSELYKDLAILFLVGAIGILLAAKTIDLASVGVVVLLVIRSLSYAQMTNVARQGIGEASPNLESLLDRVLSLESSSSERGDQSIDSIGRIALEQVGYLYSPNGRGISGVSVTIEQGEAIGVVGPSGGGKSTLVQVLLRLRRPTSGELTITGIPYVEIDGDCWHRLIALVPQEPKLFEGTLAENIRFLRSGISRDAIEQAVIDAHLLDDVQRLPDGLDTQLGPRGIGLSGGQNQRMAIARALVGKPQLLVLDEPTSALDVKSEQLLQRTIEELKGTVTMVIVAHRLTTLACCDRVISMTEGRAEVHQSLDDALHVLSFVKPAGE